jgi:hypothetical protein
MTKRPDLGPRLTVVVALLGLLGLPACAALDPLSDGPVDLEVQPLEVVVNSRSRPEMPCLLNVEEVRAGDHDVSVIGESGHARVRIVDERGRVVFRTDNSGQRIETDEDGEVTIIGGESEGIGPPARLVAGTYTVECRPEAGEAGDATLRVLPARPGRGSPDSGP